MRGRRGSLRFNLVLVVKLDVERERGSAYPQVERELIGNFSFGTVLFVEQSLTFLIENEHRAATFKCVA